MTDRQRERLAHIRETAPMYARIFERVFSSARPARADMLRARCLDCSGYQRLEAVNCAVETCPLWAVNPYRKAHPSRQSGKGKGLFRGTRSGGIRIAAPPVQTRPSATQRHQAP